MRAALTLAAALHTPHWRSCFVHLDWKTMRRVTQRTCQYHWMPRFRGKHITGHRKTCARQSPHVIRCVRLPEFVTPPARQLIPPQPMGSTESMRGYWETAHVTGYCLSGMMADGQYVHWGAVASNVLPMGSRVTIPSLGFAGAIEDRGDATMGAIGLDVWTPDCAQAYTFTGWRTVFVSS
jgi:3D (Asp-Asp-Asp) domain-containing protein